MTSAERNEQLAAECAGLVAAALHVECDAAATEQITEIIASALDVLDHNRNVAYLERVEQAEASAAASLGTIWDALNILKARPIKTAFDDDIIRLLENTATKHADAGAALITELASARAVVAVARDACAASLFEHRGPLVKAIADYDWAVQKGASSDGDV